MDDKTLVEKYNHELYHHGVTGMKWGVRRYQNKDGSLTAAGKKRYGTKANFERVQAAKKAAAKANSKQAKAKRKAEERTAAEIAKWRKKAGIKDEEPIDDTPKKKRIRDMSDEELIKAIERKRLEDRYRELNPASVSKGRQFMDSLKEDVLFPAAKEVGKNFAIKKGKEWLGLNDEEDSLKALKKEVERAKLDYEKADYKAKTRRAESGDRDVDDLIDNIRKRVDLLDNDRKLTELEDKEMRDLKREAQVSKYRAEIEKNKPKTNDDIDDDLNIDNDLAELDIDNYKKKRKNND